MADFSCGVHESNSEIADKPNANNSYRLIEVTHAPGGIPVALPWLDDAASSGGVFETNT